MRSLNSLTYMDARVMAKAIARWRVVGDLADEQLQEDSAACRYLHRRIAERTEEFVPDAIAAIKALGADPSTPRFTKAEIAAIALRATVRAELPPPGWRGSTWLAMSDAEFEAFTRAVIAALEVVPATVRSSEDGIR